MTEMETGSFQNQDTSTPVSDSQPAKESTATKPERLFKQQEVTDLVVRETKEAVERYKRSANQQSPSQQQQPQQNQAMTSSHSQDDIRRIAAEESQRLRDEWVTDTQRKAQEQEAHKEATEFFTKLSTGKEKYQDFDSVMQNVDFSRIATTVQMANMLDNTSDVMYDLVKNPTKIAQIQQLAAISPQLAYSEMQKYSQALKVNDDAANVKHPRDPLKPLRPSNTGTDSGVQSVTSLRSKYRV